MRKPKRSYPRLPTKHAPHVLETLTIFSQTKLRTDLRCILVGSDWLVHKARFAGRTHKLQEPCTQTDHSPSTENANKAANTQSSACIQCITVVGFHFFIVSYSLTVASEFYVSHPFPTCFPFLIWSTKGDRKFTQHQGSLRMRCFGHRVNHVRQFQPTKDTDSDFSPMCVAVSFRNLL